MKVLGVKKDPNNPWPDDVKTSEASQKVFPGTTANGIKLIHNLNSKNPELSLKIEAIQLKWFRECEYEKPGPDPF